MLGIDERGSAAGALHLGDDAQSERGLTGSLRSEHFHHPTARQATDAQCDVQSQRTGGHGFDIPDGWCIAQSHDRALTKLLLDLSECGSECLLAILIHACAVRVNFRSANYLTSLAYRDAQKCRKHSFLRKIFPLYTVF